MILAFCSNCCIHYILSTPDAYIDCLNLLTWLICWLPDAIFCTDLSFRDVNVKEVCNKCHTFFLYLKQLDIYHCLKCNILCSSSNSQWIHWSSRVYLLQNVDKSLRDVNTFTRRWTSSGSVSLPQLCCTHKPSQTHTHTHAGTHFCYQSYCWWKREVRCEEATCRGDFCIMNPQPWLIVVQFWS